LRARVAATDDVRCGDRDPEVRVGVDARVAGTFFVVGRPDFDVGGVCGRVRADGVGFALARLGGGVGTLSPDPNRPLTILPAAQK